MPQETRREEGTVVAGVVASVDDMDVLETWLSGNRCGGMLNILLVCILI